MLEERACEPERQGERAAHNRDRKPSAQRPDDTRGQEKRSHRSEGRARFQRPAPRRGFRHGYAM